MAWFPLVVGEQYINLEGYHISERFDILEENLVGVYYDATEVCGRQERPTCCVPCHYAQNKLINVKKLAILGSRIKSKYIILLPLSLN